jgi:predicted anti-sigma-YlaC factor YlaD
MNNGDHEHVREVVCREFVELVTDYWEGTLPEERTELVEEHLVMCDSCKIYFDQLDETVKALPATAEAEPVPPGTERTLLDAFRRRLGPG